MSRNRTPAEMAALKARIVEVAKRDPELTAQLIADRLGCRFHTVKEVLADAGVQLDAPVLVSPSPRGFTAVLRARRASR